MGNKINNSVIFDFKANIAKLKAGMNSLKSQLGVQKEIMREMQNRVSMERAIASSQKLSKEIIVNITAGHRNETNAIRDKMAAIKNEISEKQKLINLNLKNQTKSIKSKEKVDLDKNKTKLINTNTEKRLKVASNLMTKLKTDAAGLSMALSKNGIIMKKNGDLVSIYGKKLKIANLDMNKLKASSVKFNMNLLSLMFGFQMLSQAVWGFMKSAMTSYNKASGEQSAFFKMTNKLRAAWEFFKFSLIDALTQTGLFKWLLEVAFKIVNWFNKMSPAGRKLTIISLGILGVFFKIMSLFGSIGLLLMGIKGIGLKTALLKPFKGLWKILKRIRIYLAGAFKSALISAKSYFKKLGKGGKASMGKLFRSMFGIVLIIAGIAYAVTGVMDIIKFWGKDSSKVIDGIVKVLIGLGIAILGVAILIGSWPLAIVAAVLIMIAFIFKFWKQIVKVFVKIWGWLKKGWVNFVSFIKILFWTFLKIIVDIFFILLEKITWVAVMIHKGFIELVFGIKMAFAKAFSYIINKAVNFIKNLILWFNKIPGINISTSGLDKIAEWGKNLVKTVSAGRKAALELAEKPLDAVKKLKDISDKFFDNKISQIKTERDAKLKAISDETKAKIDSINKQINADKKLREENGNNGLKGSLLGGSTGSLLGGMFGSSSSDKLTQPASSKSNKTTNIFKVENLNQDIKTDNIDEESIKRISLEGLTDEYNKLSGSVIE